MTKTRRVILLTVNILTLLAGLFAFLYFAVMCFVLSHSKNWSNVPSLDEIHASQNIYFLRNVAEDTREKMLADHDAVIAFKWYIFIFGSLLFVSSIIHFWLTPWKLKDKV